MAGLRVSTLEEEGRCSTSKWLKHQVLLDEEEMRALFAELGEFNIYCTSVPVAKEEAEVDRVEFLQHYGNYVRKLWGPVPLQTLSAMEKRVFSSVFTVDPSLLFAIELPKEKWLVRTLAPVVQLQTHSVYYSPVDGKLHSMILGPDSMLWGLQFSYPQIFQYPKSYAYSKVNASFPNTPLFLKLTRWLRQHTLPTPFFVDSVRVNAPIRLGRSCFSWINEHRKLQEKGILVKWVWEK